MDEKKIEQLFEKFDVKSEKRFQDYDAKSEKRFQEIDIKFGKRIQDIDTKVEKRLDQQTKELKADYLRQGKFLLEQFGKQTQIIAEVQTDHSKKLSAILEMVAQNTVDIDIIKGMLRRKVDLEDFEALEKRVGLLEGKLRTA